MCDDQHTSSLRRSVEGFFNNDFRVFVVFLFPPISLLAKTHENIIRGVLVATTGALSRSVLYAFFCHGGANSYVNRSVILRATTERLSGKARRRTFCSSYYQDPISAVGLKIFGSFNRKQTRSRNIVSCVGRCRASDRSPQDGARTTNLEHMKTM